MSFQNSFAIQNLAVVLALVAYVGNGRREQMSSEHRKSDLADDVRPSSQSLVDLQQTPTAHTPIKALAMLLLAAHPAASWHMTGLRGERANTPARRQPAHTGMKHVPNVLPYDDTINSVQLARRGVLGLGLAAAAATSGMLNPAAAALAAEPTVKLYFGAGCFWHVQHEFVGEEVGALGRKPSQLTAVSGYAGGTKEGAGDAKVCYHNVRNIADYGRLGHAEAVQLDIPMSSVPRFAEKYFSLFGARGIRHDPGDRGGEYRSVIGLPGGEKSPLFPQIQKAADQSPGGLKLVRGRGNEGDTFSSKTVVVYDSDKFPFYPGEVYHQFHNDFMGPAYGKAYNDLQKVALDTGAIKTTGCPEGLF